MFMIIISIEIIEILMQDELFIFIRVDLIYFKSIPKVKL